MTVESIKRALDLAALAGDAALARRGIGGDDAGLAARRRLATRRQVLRGLPQKIGQFFVAPDADGDGAYDALAEAPATMSPKLAKKAMELALQKPLDAVFTSVEDTAVAASLGQVHRATLKDG